MSVESPPASPTRGLAGWLDRGPLFVLVAYSAAVAFGTYFCMYAFRKPFDATKFYVTDAGTPVLTDAGKPVAMKWIDSPLDLKTVCVIAQIVGYMLSKYLGTRIVSEVKAHRRGLMLVTLILWAGAALALFGLLPYDFKPLAMFLNGLPLGMVWGLCVRYLEGRRSAEVTIVGMSCSFIIAGAVTRDMGRDVVMGVWGVPEAFMPAATGLLFLLPFVGCVLLLNQIPPPSGADVAARGPRAEMDRTQRGAFLRHYGVGFGMLAVAYFFLTAFRDFRDHYGAEILDALGLGLEKAIFSSTEKWAMFGVMASFAGMYFIRNNRAALGVVYAVITGGFAVIGVATVLYLIGVLSGYWWMAACGVGLYLAYVPYGAVLFERMMAASRFAGTAAFAIQLADGVGYTGSVLSQLLRDLMFGQFDRLQFALPLAVVVSVVGVLLMSASGVVCVRKATPTQKAIGEP